MPDDPQNSSPGGAAIHSSSDYGTVASHPDRPADPFLVGPTVGQEFNTLSLDLIPVACLSLHDIVFEFDSSFPLPAVSNMLEKLPSVRSHHKNSKGQFPPISIFGHADPSGTSEYNKPLSGRRATAIYGLLTHNLTIWNELYQEEWNQKNALKTMRETTELPNASRHDLMDAYMTSLFPEPLTPKDFLGQGADAHGRVDYQGCSDFNPLLILSQDEEKSLSKQDRNREYSPDRRVVLFFFRPGPPPRPEMWPCPAAGDKSLADCKKRFFGPPQTGDIRMSPGADRRKFSETGDTFACRFYHRIARRSPCERGGPVLAAIRILIYVINHSTSNPEDYLLVDDGSYSQRLSSASVTSVDDNFLELRFTNVPMGGSFSLYQIFEDDDRVALFTDIPFEQLYDVGVPGSDDPVKPYPKDEPPEEMTYESDDPMVKIEYSGKPDPQLAYIRDPHLDNQETA